MPTYEYRCPEGHEFEKFYRTISAAEAAAPCPVCGKSAERQVSGGAGLMFKGSGFYLTDYGKNAHSSSKGPSKPAAKGESGSSQSEAKSETKSEKPAESKPAAPPSTKPSKE